MVSIDFVWTRSRRDRISVPLGPLSVRPDLRCNFVVHGFMEFKTGLADCDAASRATTMASRSLILIS